MNILLLNPPKDHEFALFVLDDYSTKARSNQPPLGLMYLSSYLKKTPDFNVKILDMNAKEMPINSIKAEIERFKPDIIGITCVIAKWFTVRELAKEIKKHTNVPIAVGGVNPSLYPYETLKCKDIDYVISGFGQVPFTDLCFLLKENSMTNIMDCHTRENCNKDTKGEFIFDDIDSFPLPDRSSLDINDYTMPFFPENPVTSMVTSQGCPFACHFCACKNFEPVSLRSPYSIIKELKEIESLGIRSVLFQDELFTMSTKRIKKICSKIIYEGIKLNWSVRSRANLVNIEALKMMRAAGCFNIHLGIESGTDRILGLMKKKLDTALIKKSVATIKEAGLSCTASFMLGYPDETKEEILETIDFAKSLDLNNCQFFITQPEPGTELYYQVSESKNYIGDIYSQFTSNPELINLKNNIASDILSKDELTDLLKFAYTQTKNLYDIKKGD
jgi:radical SAM superfamily enzyme YgiQ (UPF0313 family)